LKDISIVSNVNISEIHGKEQDPPDNVGQKQLWQQFSQSTKERFKLRMM